jgi:hypothetical protein
MDQLRRVPTAAAPGCLLAGALGRPKYQPTPSILWQAPANCRYVSGFQLMPDPDVGEVPEKRPKCLTPGRIPA